MKVINILWSQGQFQRQVIISNLSKMKAYLSHKYASVFINHKPIRPLQGRENGMKVP